MKYIRLFEQEYSMYEIITMTPGMAEEVLGDEIKKENPDFELIKNILDHSQADVNIRDKKGNTKLIMASFGLTEIVKLLLQHPYIDVNWQNEDGWTALIMASREGYLEIVRMLLEKPEILVNLQNSGGLTALMYASS